jgi:hypothetical protein
LPSLLRGLPQPKTTTHHVDWLGLLRLLAGDDNLLIGPAYDEHHVFFAKSAPVPHPGLSENVLKEYFGFILREGPKVPIGYFCSAQLYGGADSQITANPAAEDSL